MQKTFYILLPLLLFAATLYGQNSNNFIEVISNTGLNLNVNTQNKMQNDRTKSGALTIEVKNRSNPGPRSVNARVSTFTTPSGFTAPYIPIKLDYTSDDSPNDANLVTSPLPLTITDQTLFKHNKHPNNATYNFYYDLIFTATNWDFPPGTYNYTITFNFDYPWQRNLLFISAVAALTTK